MAQEEEVDTFEAAQAALLLEEAKLRAHPRNPGSWNDEYRKSPMKELVGLLKGMFDDDDTEELVFKMMVEAYRLGRDER